MQAWFAALAAELEDWPQVTQKGFVGVTALYRDKMMFGLLPRTCSTFKGNSRAFRLDETSRTMLALLEKDSRISRFDKDKTRWITSAGPSTPLVRPSKKDPTRL